MNLETYLAKYAAEPKKGLGVAAGALAGSIAGQAIVVNTLTPTNLRDKRIFMTSPKGSSASIKSLKRIKLRGIAGSLISGASSATGAYLAQKK